MSAIVRWPVRHVPAGLASIPCPGRAAVFVFACVVAGGTPAAAQLSGSLTLQSDHLYRGYSLTGGAPTASLDVGYDDPSGLYLNGSVFSFVDDDRPAVGGAQANIGYARRLSPRLSADGGVLQSHYRVGPGGRSLDFTEIYVGVTRRPLAVRIFYSPDYYGTDRASLYAEVDATIEPARAWRVSGHVGVLDYVSGPYSYSAGGVRYDWRLSVERQIGKVALRAAVSDAERRGGPYGRQSSPRLVVGGTFSF